MQRQWDPQLDALGARLEAPAQADFRLIEARFFGPEEATDKYHVYVRVLDRNGSPLQDHPFRVSNGGTRVERTKGPGFDDFYGNAPLFAGSAYAVDIPEGSSDRVTGLTRAYGGNPSANMRILLVFQRDATIEPAAPLQPSPSPAPAPTPPGGGLDPATRARLVALLDKAQAEIDAARRLLEVTP